MENKITKTEWGDYFCYECKKWFPCEDAITSDKDNILSCPMCYKKLEVTSTNS